MADLAKMDFEPRSLKLDIVCPSQDVIFRDLNEEQALAWVDNQINASSSFVSFQFNVFVANQSYIFNAQLTHYNIFWTQIKDKGIAEFQDKLPWILEQSNKLNFILFDGTLWTNIQELVKTNQQAAGIAIFEYSNALPQYKLELRTDYLQAYNEAAKFFQLNLIHPVMRSFPSLVQANLNSELASSAAISARQSLVNVDQGLKILQNELESRKKQFDQLADLYNVQLALEDPVRNWEAINVDAQRFSFAWLACFISGIIFPALYAFAYREDIINFLKEILASQQGAFNISAIVIVLLPMLAWGWLLKHMSRGFVGNRMIAMDARHRQILAKTFVGFSKAEGIDMTENDRAIILNALYRPVSPHSADDGPPMGLIDLVRGKQ